MVDHACAGCERGALDWHSQAAGGVVMDRDTYRDENSRIDDDATIACLKAERDALRAEVERLRDALEPFAGYADLPSFNRLPDDQAMTRGSGIAACQVTAQDFKIALDVFNGCAAMKGGDA